LHAPPPSALAPAPASANAAAPAAAAAGVLDGAADAPGAKGDGNDFLCTPWGCVGGVLTAGLSDFRSSPEGTFPSNFGWTVGGDIAAPVPFLERHGLGVQTAGSYGQYDLDGRDSALNQAKQRQGFFSAGMFRRPDAYGPWWSRWGAGVAYDIAMNQNAGTRADDYQLRQWRFKASYDVTAAHELGVWAAVHDNRANVRNGGVTDRFKAVDQLNFFYKYHLENGGSLMAYGGPGIGGSLLASSSIVGSHPLEYTAGASAIVPISDYVAVFADGAYGAGGSKPAAGAASSSAMAW
jgi:hypothetical protein